MGLPVTMVGPLHLRSDVTGRLAPVLALLQGGALYLQPEEDRTLPPLRHTLALTDALVSTPANDYMRASRAGASGRISLQLGSDEWEMQAPTAEGAAEWVVQLGSAIPLARIPRRYEGALDDDAAAAAGQGDSDGEDEASVSASVAAGGSTGGSAAFFGARRSGTPQASRKGSMRLKRWSPCMRASCRCEAPAGDRPAATRRRPRRRDLRLAPAERLLTFCTADGAVVLACRRRANQGAGRRSGEAGDARVRREDSVLPTPVPVRGRLP